MPRQIVSISNRIQWFCFVFVRDCNEWFSLFSYCAASCVRGWWNLRARSWLLLYRKACCLRLTFIQSLLIFRWLRYLYGNWANFFLLVEELWIWCNIFASLFSWINIKWTNYTTWSVSLLVVLKRTLFVIDTLTLQWWLRKFLAGAIFDFVSLLVKSLEWIGHIRGWYRDGRVAHDGGYAYWSLSVRSTLLSVDWVAWILKHRLILLTKCFTVLRVQSQHVLLYIRRSVPVSCTWYSERRSLIPLTWSIKFIAVRNHDWISFNEFCDQVLNISGAVSVRDLVGGIANTCIALLILLEIHSIRWVLIDAEQALVHNCV